MQIAPASIAQSHLAETRAGAIFRREEWEGATLDQGTVGIVGTTRQTIEQHHGGRVEIDSAIA